MHALRWLPWRFIVRHAARAHGFLDPISVLSALQRFTQPSEVAEPVELLRAGAVLHARGLLNSRVIQHNLDWVWPFWVERQFDPADDAFIPRAFSLTHINLTHRNWTAVGTPDYAELPIVDPRGLLTPILDRWSLDVWVITRDGKELLPSRAEASHQSLDLSDGLAIATECQQDGLHLHTRVEVRSRSGMPTCELRATAFADAPAWLVVALRPCNPEGVSLLHSVSLSADRREWQVEGQHSVQFDAPTERHHVSDYHAGDVHIHLHEREEQSDGHCEVGMLTAAALFEIEPNNRREITTRIPLGRQHEPNLTWDDALAGHCRADLPDDRMQRLYDAGLRTLILHSPDDVFPGPYTYKRFWFRDAAFIVHALLCAGFTSRAERALDRFPARQDASGYFHSQEGEWDANGEALWAMQQFCAFSGCDPKPMWRDAIMRGAHWIHRKRSPDDRASPHAGLLPAGFSAEHLGPSDYYYWDDFWGIAGLRAAGELALRCGDEHHTRLFRTEADTFMAAVDRSLAQAAKRIGGAAVPASPYRRLDAGAIGSLALGYPLRLCAPDDPRLLATVDFLLEHCFVDGGFFQDMIHSGINPYLTLHVAQILLRAGDSRFQQLLEAVAGLSSPTGQWPEAIHPRTRGGCMGDGHHVWAAAEWVCMLRHCFVREEEDRLVLASGIPDYWLESREPISFGPAPTAFGTVTIWVRANDAQVTVAWEGEWHNVPARIEVRVPGTGAAVAELDQGCVSVTRGQKR